MQKNRLNVTPGNPQIPGASYVAGACNFTIEAGEESEVFLLLYKGRSQEPWQEIELGEDFRQGSVFSCLVNPVEPREISYSYRINGKNVPDPCGKVFLGRGRFGAALDPEKPREVRCGILPHEDASFLEDKLEDRKKRPALEEMLLYKLHVRGYTKACPEVTPQKRGTFAGLEERIGYLKELGVNAVELMPCYEFSELPAPPPAGDMVGMVGLKPGPGKINFWGYGPGYYFAPKASYCMGNDAEGEVRSLIRSLHQAGIACILEFYFPAEVTPFTVLHALHFWRLHYHVDGFHLLGPGAALSMVLRDSMLSDTYIFAQQEDFPEGELDKKKTSGSFATYNSGFLEDMRRFMKSDEGMVDSVRYRFSRGERSYGVINYMAFQDGFTLRDMVSYNYRHNEDNGEGGQDGSDLNYSWNCGVEGPSRKAAIRLLRERQERNAFALLLLSRGTPLIYAGDEFGNSQKGNNNAYCQDNPVGWVDWKAKERNKELLHYVKAMIAFRKEHRILWEGGDLTQSRYRRRGYPILSFHGERAWFCSNEASSRLLGVMYVTTGEKEYHYYIGMNFYWEEREIALPTLPRGGEWKVIFSTFDQNTWAVPGEGHEKTLSLPPRSVTFLEGEPGQAREEEPQEETQELPVVAEELEEDLDEVLEDEQLEEQEDKEEQEEPAGEEEEGDEP